MASQVKNKAKVELKMAQKMFTVNNPNNGMSPAIS